MYGSMILVATLNPTARISDGLNYTAFNDDARRRQVRCLTNPMKMEINLNLRNKYYLLTLGPALSSDVGTLVSDKNLT